MSDPETVVHPQEAADGFDEHYRLGGADSDIDVSACSAVVRLRSTHYMDNDGIRIVNPGSAYALAGTLLAWADANTLSRVNKGTSNKKLAKVIDRVVGQSIDRAIHFTTLAFQARGDGSHDEQSDDCKSALLVAQSLMNVAVTLKGLRGVQFVVNGVREYGGILALGIMSQKGKNK